MRSILRVGVPIFSILWVVSFHAIAQQRPAGPTPVAGLTPAQQLAFNEGSRVFSHDYSVAEGRGPVFNDESCADCHRGGGATNRTVRRFGRTENGMFDPLAELGGSLIQSRGIGSVTTVDGTHEFVGERTPSDANVSTARRTTSLFGLGFVDAVPDATWLAVAQLESTGRDGTAGRVNIVQNIVSSRHGKSWRRNSAGTVVGPRNADRTTLGAAERGAFTARRQHNEYRPGYPASRRPGAGGARSIHRARRGACGGASGVSQIAVSVSDIGTGLLHR